MQQLSSFLKSPLRHALSGTLILAIAFGFGRFAYTAIYPHMMQDHLISLQQGGYIASANYLGYLIGALLSVRIKQHNASLYTLIATVGSSLGLLLLGFVDNIWAIIAIRLIAGALSAFAMVAASIWLLQNLQLKNYAPLLYAGVGSGIALSSGLIILGETLNLSSQSLWLFIGISTLVLASFAIPSLLSHNQVSPSLSSSALNTPTLSAKRLIIAYGLTGFGYIMTATYLPTLVKRALPELGSTELWALFGLMAAPSCWVWHKCHLKLGHQNALILNLLVQGIGVILPVILPNSLGYLCSAALTGGTFMGTVTLVISAAQQHQKHNLIALLTLFYSIGQILGPLVANILFSITGTLNAALIAASLSLLIAAGICLQKSKATSLV